MATLRFGDITGFTTVVSVSVLLPSTSSCYHHNSIIITIIFIEMKTVLHMHLITSQEIFDIDMSRNDQKDAHLKHCH